MCENEFILPCVCACSKAAAADASVNAGLASATVEIVGTVAEVKAIDKMLKYPFETVTQGA